MQIFQNHINIAFDLICTLKDIDIELDPSTMCRILGVNDEGDEVYDSNN